MRYKIAVCPNFFPRWLSLVLVFNARRAEPLFHCCPAIGGITSNGKNGLSPRPLRALREIVFVVPMTYQLSAMSSYCPWQKNPPRLSGERLRLSRGIREIRAKKVFHPRSGGAGFTLRAPSPQSKKILPPCPPRPLREIVLVRPCLCLPR
jgi:hypothetical protein